MLGILDPTFWLMRYESIDGTLDLFICDLVNTTDLLLKQLWQLANMRCGLTNILLDFMLQSLMYTLQSFVELVKVLNVKLLANPHLHVAPAITSFV